MPQVTNIPYEQLKVGQKVRIERQVQARDILLFAAVSGDTNPVHLDPEFAASTLFKGVVAHGMFTGALISATVACHLPGPGTIYLGQHIAFQKPVRLGDTLYVEIEVQEKLEKNRVILATRVYNQRDEEVVDGQAEVLAPRRQQTVEMPEVPKVTVG